MKTLLSLFLVVTLTSACTATQKKVTLMPEAFLKIDSRLLEVCSEFLPREANTLTEAELLVEFGTLSSAYGRCYNNHKALSDLIKQELSPK